MTYLNESPPSELAHYGVKGMKWGVRKAHPSYSHEQQLADRKKLGRRGAEKINRRMHLGETHDDAFENVKANRNIKRAIVLVYGAFVAKNLLRIYGPTVISKIAERAETNRGRAAVLGIDMWKPISAVRRGGVYKVTTL